MSSTNKILYFEIMRVVACFFVVFDHVSNFSYGLLTTFIDWFNLFWYFFCRFSVPLFFMISGALLLGRDLTIKKMLNHIIRMGIILLLFSFIYYVLITVYNRKSILLGEFIRQLYSDCGSFNASFWFIYAYIGFLVIIPFLRLLVTNMTNKHFNYLIIIMIMCSAINVFEYFMLKGNTTTNVILQGYSGFSWLTNTSIFYPIVGYYLDNKVAIERVGKNVSLLWIINILCIFFSILLTFYKIHLIKIDDGNFQTFRWTFTYFNAIAIFLTVKYICCVKVQISKGLQKVFKDMGACTFGIYLIHWALLLYIKPLLSCSNVLSCFFMSLVVFVTCYLIVRLLKLIPVVNKYI